MDNTRAATMIQRSVLLFVLGLSTLMLVQAVELHHLKKEGRCPPITKFPSSVKVSLNMNGQDSAAVSGGVRKRSISPWEYRYDINDNRFPSKIAEAQCLHTGCVDSEGNVDINLNSVPIKQEILVLHREMKGCVPSFRMEKKMVTVGCTCVRPLVQEQQ